MNQFKQNVNVNIYEMRPMFDKPLLKKKKITLNISNSRITICVNVFKINRIKNEWQTPVHVIQSIKIYIIDTQLKKKKKVY